MEALQMPGAMRFWITFDLGLRSTNQKLYEWLDKVKARECGPFAATFQSTKPRSSLIKELGRLVDGQARLYLIGRETPEDKVIGGFVLGRRKAAPWEGFAEGFDQEEDR
jgi:hypothetical protein